MNSLGCFKDKEKLRQELLKPDHNTGTKYFPIRWNISPERNILPSQVFNDEGLIEILCRKSDIFLASWSKTAQTVPWRWNWGGFWLVNISFSLLIGWLQILVRARCGSSDPPRKRVDHCKLNGVTYSQLSQGSPITPRRNLYRCAWQLLQRKIASWVKLTSHVIKTL